MSSAFHVSDALSATVLSIAVIGPDARRRGEVTSALAECQDGQVHEFNAYPASLGDVVLALETIAAEADSQGKSLADHVAHLVVHGALHLAGYDHHQAGEARRMELAEARILHRLRVPNPWKRA